MNQPETKTAPKSAFTVKETCYAGLFAAVIANHGADIHSDAGRRSDDDADVRGHARGDCTGREALDGFDRHLSHPRRGRRSGACGFTGGLAKFVGPTGGFLISFPLMAFVIGWGVEHRRASRVRSWSRSSQARC